MSAPCHAQTRNGPKTHRRAPGCYLETKATRRCDLRVPWSNTSGDCSSGHSGKGSGGQRPGDNHVATVAYSESCRTQGLNTSRKHRLRGCQERSPGVLALACGPRDSRLRGRKTFLCFLPQVSLEGCLGTAPKGAWPLGHTPDLSRAPRRPAEMFSLEHQLYRTAGSSGGGLTCSLNYSTLVPHAPLSLPASD